MRERRGSPADGFQYAGPLTVTANATDELEVTKMELYVDGQKIGGQQSGAKFSLNWDGAKKLSNAKHTVTLKAYDPALNVGTASVSVTKVDPAQLTVPAAKLAFAVGKVKSGRNLTISGRVTAPGATFKPKGKIRVFVELKKHGRYKQISRYTKGAAHGFKLKIKLKSAGSWRIWARYSAQPPFKSLRSKYFVLKAR